MQTRRQFLQLAGIAVIGSQFLPTFALDDGVASAAVQGRALAAVPVTLREGGMPVRHLWPDSVTTIQAAQGGWYRLSEGFVPRALIQPMKPYAPTTLSGIPGAPFWAEVAGPVAVVRRHCAADAPLVTRIGHGGVARVIDLLPGEPSPWYGVASETGDLLGWTQAAPWRPVEASNAVTGRTHLEIDTPSATVTAWHDGDLALRAPAAFGRVLRPGTYSIGERSAGGRRLNLDAPLHGVPWNLTFGGFDLAGVYWHNRFGDQVPGPAVQVTPLLAQWLYARLPEGAAVVVR